MICKRPIEFDLRNRLDIELDFIVRNRLDIELDFIVLSAPKREAVI